MHPYRPLRRRAQKEKKATVTPVHLIEAREKLCLNMSDSDIEDVAEESTLSFRDSMVILKGEFDLVSGNTEDQIRQELVDVFKTKLPLMGKNDFEFVKRARQLLGQHLSKDTSGTFDMLKIFAVKDDCMFN